MKETAARRYLVAMLGARAHYAVPRILQRHGLLSRFHTDFYLGPLSHWLSSAVVGRLGLDATRRALGRWDPELRPALVSAHPALGVEYALRRRLARNRNVEQVYAWVGARFAREILAAGLGDCDAIYGFNSASAELFTHIDAQRCKRVLEQTIAPKEVEVELMERERQRFPDALQGTEPALGAAALAARERVEWESAHQILAPSPFVVQALVGVGVPAEKIALVPYGVDTSHGFRVRPFRIPPKEGPLKVLFVGQVGIRKGAHRLIQAARLLERAQVEFRMVGPVALNPRLLAQVPSNMQVVGAVPRSEIARHYEWADVFCLPSLCEGSAIVTYEAMALGLPVIATRSAGSLVRDGIDGFVLDVDDPLPSLVESILRVRGYPFAAASERSASEHPFSLEAYASRLISALS